MGLSKWAHEVGDYIPKNAFKDIPSIGVPTDSDLDSFIRMYIFESIPSFIIRKPIVFDKIRSAVASSLEISNSDIKLTGSAKLGFSLNPGNWLEEYRPGLSDLDFFIISRKLYELLLEDIKIWQNNIQNNSEQEKFYLVERNSKKGFIDTWHIPRRHIVTNKCAHAMHRACLNINNMVGEEIVAISGKNASIRCYKDYYSALKQIKLNIRHAIRQMNKVSPSGMMII